MIGIIVVLRKYIHSFLIILLAVFISAHSYLQPPDIPENIIVSIQITENDSTLTGVRVHFAAIVISKDGMLAQQEAVDYGECYIDEIQKYCQTSLNIPKKRLVDGEYYGGKTGCA